MSVSIFFNFNQRQRNLPPLVAIVQFITRTIKEANYIQEARVLVMKILM